MKLLCVADTISPIVHSSHIRERFRHVDLVLSAGDLPMEYLGFIASGLNKPVIFVFGNHNLKRLDDYRRRNKSGWSRDIEELDLDYGATYIDRRVISAKGLLIAGLGGSIMYNRQPNQFTDRQMFWRCVSLLPRLAWNRLVHGRWLDILLTHAAPLGINDRDDRPHVGFRSFLWFMRWFKPRFLLHGHIHLWNLNEPRETQYFETRVVNVYDWLVLDTGGADG